MSTAPAFAVAALPDPSAQAVDLEVRRGLTQPQKSLAPWLFYDEAGSELFEQITELPEYYLTRTERALFTAHASQIFAELGLGARDNSGQSRESQSNGPSPHDLFEDAVKGTRSAPIPFPRSLTVVELGAGTASKTGILLRTLVRLQREVLYQPVDISPSALAEAQAQLANIAGLTIRPHLANYVSQRFQIVRPAGARVLALYIGSSIGNFSPAEARDILVRLRAQLAPGDALLLGADLAPSLAGTDPPKQISTLLAAYNDAAGVTAAFNRNVLDRLNRELGANFDVDRFAHRAIWNAARSRIEMHLVSLEKQTIILPRGAAGPALPIHFAAGETIHTENSYKFTPAALAALLSAARFAVRRTFTDLNNLFSVTLACAE
jgi:dimethylhistidine N-methyltransferase